MYRPIDPVVRHRRSVRELNADQYADMFDEAIQLKMIPYHFKVWDVFYFSKCDSHAEIELLLEIHFKLRYTLNKDAKTILRWCRERQFNEKVMFHIPEAKKHAVVREGKWIIPVNRQRQHDYSEVRTLWFKQAKGCHSCPNCGNVLGERKRERYPYLAFGMIVWRMSPEDEDDMFRYRNIWQYLGYDYVDNEHLFNAYMKSFSPNIGVGHISFEAYLNRIESTKRLLSNLPEGSSDYDDLVTLLKNDKSIWRFKEALESGLSWKDVQNDTPFKDVVQKYGYDQLHLFPEGEVEEVACKLNEAYNTVFDKNPVGLHHACEGHHLQTYVPSVWSEITGADLDSQVKRVLAAADGQKFALKNTR